MMNPLNHMPRSRKFWGSAVLVIVIVVFVGRQIYLHRQNMSYLDVMLGCQQVQGVAESGFHFQEQDQGAPFRWTNGHAKLLVPINKWHPPERLRISIETFRPKSDPIHFRVLVDGESLYDGTIPMGKWETTLDLSSLHLNDPTMIELLSDTFVPKGVLDNGKNTDTRVLGVQVKGVTLARGEE